MKNLTKIFMLVVAGMLAFSCVTDTTNDPTFEVGEAVGTEISISLEDSRTLLGDKDAEGKYPLYWSEGDAIAINGTASSPLVGVTENSPSATFRFPKVLTHPYHVVYPAPAEGVEAVTEGCYPVVIPETQAYTEGSFESGVAPMYGSTTADGGDIVMHHLTGILRIAPYGNGEEITGIVVKAENGYLAGTFDVNCETGALTAHDDASNSIAVTFAEPFVLGAEAKPIYVAVPAGSYGTISIILSTKEHGKMLASFDSDKKPINHSVVKELGSFPFSENYTSEEEGVFEIDGVDALIEFASIAGNFAPYTEAKVVAPIDMTGVEWTPIENFGQFTFNGGEYAITGLSAPLFGTTSATIKNVNLENVAIASNGRLVLGAVACTLATGDNSSISNCHVTGTITVSNPEATIASSNDLTGDDDNKYTTVNYGGIVGTSNGNVDNCVNEANITVNQVAKSDNTVVLHPNIGGIVGYSVTGAVTNCVNGNEAKTTGAINYHDNQTDLLYVPSVAGVVGLRGTSNAANLTGNKNYGAISFKANSAGNNAINFDSSTVGGIVGYSKGNVQNNDNYGTITVADCDVKALYVGGVIGVVVPGTPVKENLNHTGANITVTNDVTFHCLTVAGAISALYGGLTDANGGGLFSCSNDGAININASTASDIALVASNYYRIGGVVGYINRAVNGCENKANGDITLEGDVVLTRTNAQSGYNVAGVYAYHSTDASCLGGNTNRGDINVYTNVSKHASATASQTTYYKLDIGGIGAHTQRPLVGKEENFGNITIGKADGTEMGITANNIYIAGGVANRHNRTNGTEGSVVNHGHITINSGVTLDSSTLGVYIGGCAAGSLKACDYHNYTNAGNITINGKITDLTYLGGIVAYSYGPMTDCTNTGAITTASTSEIAGVAHIGGAVGYAVGNLSSVKNNAGGNVSVEGTFGDQLHLGGLTGYYGKNASDEAVLTLTLCENHGNITLNATTNSKKATYMGGLVAEYFGTAATDCSNSGDITLTKCSSNSNSDGEVWINLGGLFGYTRTALTLTNCNNSGTISAAKGLSANAVFTAAGFIGGSKANITLDNCHNSMKPDAEWGIKLENTVAAGSGSNQSRVGGLIGWHSSGLLTTQNGVSNSANIYVAIINNDTGGSSYGGLVGVLGKSTAHSFDGTVSNSGDIYYAGTSKSGTFCIGGLFGQNGGVAPMTYDNLVCTGNITITKEGGANWKPTASKYGCVGGIFGMYGTAANASLALSNAKFFGKITAIDFEDTHSTSYQNIVGAIVAGIGTTTLTNCHIGGEIVLSTKTTIVGSDPEAGIDGEEVLVNVPGVLTVNNYAAYLSGDHTFTAAAAKEKTCGFISSINATPVYAE